MEEEKGPTKIMLGERQRWREKRRQRNKRRRRGKKDWKRGHDWEMKKKFFKDIRGTESKDNYSLTARG